ncbi:hypothetical protein O1611_g3364 [Lasiodiplodia mahajangana]|uniref:Uncharacterized protein n=1 Tax=Lasiodiplodia mahajangana TaxID=1108764 RepID=A0ACC2JRZ2_9PEZI|nr:hypothetical protein O1611_g3364 [Lasiodiplodia mahajangana]
MSTVSRPEADSVTGGLRLYVMYAILRKRERTWDMGHGTRDKGRSDMGGTYLAPCIRLDRLPYDDPPADGTRSRRRENPPEKPGHSYKVLIVGIPARDTDPSRTLQRAPSDSNYPPRLPKQQHQQEINMMALASNPSYKMFHRPSHEHQDFMLFPDSSTRAGYTSPPMDMSMSPNSFGFPRSPQDEFIANPPFDHGPAHHDVNAFMYRGRTSPGLYADEGDLRLPASNLSTASAPSPSSTVGSPNSNHGQLAFMPEYATSGINVNPSIVGSGDYFASTEYAAFTGPGMEEFTMPFDSKSTFVGELARISTAASTHGTCLSSLPLSLSLQLRVSWCFAQSSRPHTPCEHPLLDFLVS